MTRGVTPPERPGGSSGGAGELPDLVDSHCHLTHDRFAGGVEAVLERALAAGVVEVVSVASTVEDAQGAREIARGSQDGSFAGARVHFTAGTHPHEAAGARAEDDRLDDLLADPACVAVGECGLDFHYDLAPREVQARVFDAHLLRAEATGLPVVVHCRDAEAAMAPRVREAGEAGVTGVLHCFPGDLSLLETAMEAGWAVSFTGLVSFRNFRGQEAVRQVLPGRYFLETDGPYMAPVPHRGKRNEPAFVPHVAEAVARIRGEAPARVARETTRAARTFFRLPDPAR